MLIDFIRDAGGWGVASVVAAFLAFGIAIYDHANDKPVSAFVFVCLSVPLFWLGAYLAWKKERGQAKELEQKLKPMLRVSPEVHRQPFDGRGATYKIDIINESAGNTAREVKVSITDMEPREVHWLPIPLHLKHDNPKPNSPVENKREIDIHPRDRQQVDLVIGWKNQTYF